MKKGLVSVITPCFNTGDYLHWLLDSVLEQTYPYIQMIVVDDGSTDNSRQIIESYVPKFNDRGYSLEYVYQENQGQSAAIQTGLDYVKGEFLVWPDSDDYYASPCAIERMVDALVNSPAEYAMVRTQENIVYDSDRDKVICVNGTLANEYEPKDLFEDCLFVKNNFYFCSGAYMLRMEEFENSTELPIFTSKDAGQNWQLLLPMLYKYRCMTILEPLYNVVDRISSHSRGSVDTDEKWLIRRDTYCDTIVGTLDRIKGMPDDERSEYKRKIREIYFFEKLDFCLNKGYNKKVKSILKSDISDFRIGKKYRLKIILSQIHLYPVYKLYAKIRRRIG